MKKLTELEKRQRTYEKKNRQKKINSVIKEIDITVYNFLSAMDRDWWNKMFLAVKRVPPSDKSVKEILNRYFRRIKR